MPIRLTPKTGTGSLVGWQPTCTAVIAAQPTWILVATSAVTVVVIATVARLCGWKQGRHQRGPLVELLAPWRWERLAWLWVGPWAGPQVPLLVVLWALLLGLSFALGGSDNESAPSEQFECLGSLYVGRSQASSVGSFAVSGGCLV